jgi:hypothetical protein
MPDQNSLKPSEISVPAPATQADGQQQSGSEPDRQEANLMQSSPTSPVTQLTAPPDQNQGDGPQRIPNWLQQAERFLRVIVRLYLGLLVCCAPWYPAAWDNNPLFASSPWLMSFISHGAVRGVVSGLGILNLWIAIREALRSPANPGQR